MSIEKTIKSRKLIIHAGLPKTGSSALQSLLYEERSKLLELNILYPEMVQNLNIPKHRWLIHSLLNNNMSLLEILRNIPEKVDKVIISEESISNEFYNIDAKVFKSFITTLKDMMFEVEIYLVIRNKKKWSTSYYKQCVINGVSQRMTLYSTSMLYKEFVKDSSFKKLLNFDNFVDDMRETAETDIFVLDYDILSIEEIFYHLTGIKSNKENKTVNESLPDLIIEIFRQLNSLISNQKEKSIWAKVLQIQSKSEHVALNILASRVSKVDIINLDIQKLEQILFVDNIPLVYTEYELKALINEMKNIILDLKNI